MKLKPLRVGKKPPPNKHQWTATEIEFLKNNFENLTNKQLASKLKLTLTMVRTKCYELGMKRMELEYWTEEQVAYLKANYKQIGDVEMAEIFQEKWPKKKGWTLKHIEKKRLYLKLQRTKEEVAAVKARNIKKGRFAICVKKRWLKTGTMAIGTVRYWKKTDSEGDFPVIKTETGYKHWNRWKWEQVYGKIPKGMNVVFKDRNNKNLTIENLMLLSNEELAIHNYRAAAINLTDNWVAGILSHGNSGMRQEIKANKKLIEAKRLQLQLNRTINEQSRKNK